jgi:hypothetical protein
MRLASTTDGEEYAFDVTQVQWDTNIRRYTTMPPTTNAFETSVKIPTAGFEETLRPDVLAGLASVDPASVTSSRLGFFADKYVSRIWLAAIAAETHTMGVRVSIRRTMTPAK